jgi:nucleotide-binding universal stress UspA family protein
MVDFKTILCPTDFSDCSQRALEYATELAKTLGGELRLLHVVQLPLYVGLENGPATVAASAQYLEELRQRSEQRLRSAVEACHQSSGVKVSGSIAEGAAHVSIVAASEDADLVVMGTHGRSGLPRLLVGSVAERVVRLAHCPVLTIPPSTDE